MTKIIAIANQKGGVGKTTTAVNLAAFLANNGSRVLVADCDPQGNTTSGLGINKVKGLPTIYESLVLKKPIAEQIITTTIERLDCLAADVNLSGAEVEMTGMPEREKLLKNALIGNVTNYDYVIIDCPPSLGLLTINSLTAADSVLIPLQCEFYALEGMTQLLETIGLIKQGLNPDLQIEGILPTMYDPRNNISKQVLAKLRTHFAKYLFDTIIPRNVRLSEAPSHGLPIMLYDKNSSGAYFYSQLATEITNQLP